MQTRFGHAVFNVRPANLPFYRDLLSFLGWQSILEEEGMLGFAGSGGASLWFIGQVKDVANDYDGPGVNHLAFNTATQADVDAAATHLTARGVPMLFDTPRHRPEFSGSAENTYYQIMFESPDRILFEVVYIGPKA